MMEKQVCSIVHEAYARQKGEFFVKKARAFFIFAGSEKKPFKCARLRWHILSNYFGMMCTVLRHLIANQI